jgi:hypothetical protein
MHGLDPRSDAMNGPLRKKVGITACSDLDNLAWRSFHIPRLPRNDWDTENAHAK